VLVIAVPARAPAGAKRRLAPLLDAGERAALARAMLRDVLRALRAAAVGAVWVVTEDPEVAALATALGAEPLREPAPRGHTAAVALAQARAAARARAFLTIPGDVPCVGVEEIRALAAAVAGPPPAVALVPSRSGLGTNGAALAPPAAMPLAFGEPSFANHVAAARARGLEPRVLALPGLGLDIDGPEDLVALLAEGARTESGRLLARWAVAERLARRAPRPA